MRVSAILTVIACATAAVPSPGPAPGSPLSARAGGVVEFFQDRDGWMSAGGAFASVGFTGLKEFTILTDQYEDLGLLFPDDNDSIVKRSSYTDGYGVYGGGFGEDGITTAFSQPKFWIAVDYPGCITFQLFRKGKLVYESSNHHSGAEIAFFGLVSDEPFDAAYIFDPEGDTFIDNLYFGPPCSVDLDGGGDVDFADVLWLLRAWGGCPAGQRCVGDLDGSGRGDHVRRRSSPCGAGVHACMGGVQGSAQVQARRPHHKPAPSVPHSPSSIRSGLSRHSFTCTRNRTACSPSTMRWS